MEEAVRQKFESYPDDVRRQLMTIREILFKVAKEDNAGAVTETLKWGEPAYLTKKGSTVRMDWKPKYPTQVAVYFHCTTCLIETFKEIYPGVFNFEGKRGIIFQRAENVPLTELRVCISMALRYHSIKHLPLLGA